MVNRNEDPWVTLNIILAASALTGYRIPYILIYFEPNFFYKLTYPRVFLDLRDLFTAYMLASCNGKLSTWSTAFVWLQDHFESFALHKATVHFDTLGWYDTSNPRIGPNLSAEQHPKKTHDRFEERVQPYLHVSRGILHLRYL